MLRVRGAGEGTSVGCHVGGTLVEVPVVRGRRGKRHSVEAVGERLLVPREPVGGRRRLAVEAWTRRLLAVVTRRKGRLVLGADHQCAGCLLLLGNHHLRLLLLLGDHLVLLLLRWARNGRKKGV